MSISLKNRDGQKIVIEKDPFGSGAEGNIHKIISPAKYKSYCAKLYKSDISKIKDKENKILFMSNNKPSQLEGGNYRFCWPEDVLYRSNIFVGFIMKLAFSDSVLAYELTLPKINKRLGYKWEKQYPRKGRELEKRLKICTNITIAIHIIHNTEKYIFVDLKPQNMFITLDGKVSIIDCDSFQISDNNKVIFQAKFMTPEYSPIERENINPSNCFIPKSWDYFSCAVIFYQIIFGIHPYTASFIHPFDKENEIHAKITKGLFVHGKNKKYIKVAPDLHRNYGVIPNSLKKLFLRAFEVSNNMPDVRPSTEEWGQTLTYLILNQQANATFKSTKPRKPNKTSNDSIQPQVCNTNSNHSKNNSSNNDETWVTWMVWIIIIIIIIYAFNK